MFVGISGCRARSSEGLLAHPVPPLLKPAPRLASFHDSRNSTAFQMAALPKDIRIRIPGRQSMAPHLAGEEEGNATGPGLGPLKGECLHELVVDVDLVVRVQPMNRLQISQRQRHLFYGQTWTGSRQPRTTESSK